MDYRRERMTMDEGYQRAVMRHFVHLWERGWLYRDNRIVNWCPFHASSLSDLELDRVEADDELVYVRYPFADGDGHVTIATVRPATILADVAVAVHPEDDRYRDLVGREVIVPFVERRVPIIADERVEPEFGTGALKVTPGHDPTDFEIGRAHGLPEPMVIGPDGRMNENAGELAGLTQEEAGARVLAWCEERGLLEKREPYRHQVARLRPLPEPDRAADLAAVVVPDGRAQAAGARRAPRRPCDVPPPVAAPLRDRLARERARLEHLAADLVGPPDPGLVLPGRAHHRRRDEPPACAECGSTELRRDADVLDTWFSSALWPFATLGWPDDTPDLRRFYPGDFNITAREIIRLWENRMIFSGLELMGDVPFRDVIIYSTVLAPDGRRMSKSLGTGIDPIETIDAARRRRDPLRADEDVLGAGRPLLDRRDRGGPEAREQALERRAADPLERRGRRAGRCAPRARRSAGSWPGSTTSAPTSSEHLAAFDFAKVADGLYHLTFDDFCDWYAEAIKPRLYDGDEDARATALAALERLLKLLHPAMPHVTEEIWSNLPDRETRLIVASWPEADDRCAADADALERRADWRRRSSAAAP